VKYTRAFNREVDPDETEYLIRGVVYTVTVPGYGPVFFNAGFRIIVAVDDDLVIAKLAGNFRGDTEILCEAMDQ
jgi:hypothetical protein